MGEHLHLYYLFPSKLVDLLLAFVLLLGLIFGGARALAWLGEKWLDWFAKVSGGRR